MRGLQELHDVAVQLDAWIDGRCGDNGPVATVLYSPKGASAISIGAMMVWCSEASAFNPTFDNCRDEYLMLIYELAPFMGEAEDLVSFRAKEEVEAAQSTRRTDD